MKNNKNKLLKQTFWDFASKTLFLAIGMFFLIFFIMKMIEISDWQWVFTLSPKWYYQAKMLFDTGNWIPNIYLFVGGVGIIIIFVWIYFLLKKVFSYIKALEEASKKLIVQDEEYIKLPEGLEEIESRMNELKQTALNNARKAEKNEKKKNDLIVYLAHDLKTPLTSMIGYLSLLDDIKDMPKKQREKYTKIALEKSYKLEDLLSELFDIARWNAETIVLEKEELHLGRMLEQIIDDFYPILKEEDKEILYNSKETIVIEGDPDKLYRVFNNILKNAIYYSTDKIITIETEKKEEMAIIRVINKGKNIPKEKLDRLFEKFYRVDTSRASKTGGSGLGLAIAKEIVTLHQGKIAATCEKHQITFQVELPSKKS